MSYLIESLVGRVIPNEMRYTPLAIGLFAQERQVVARESLSGRAVEHQARHHHFLLVDFDEREKAVEVILKKGLAKSAKRAGAVASEGLVATGVSPDGKSGVIVEVNIQTDFAARNDDFKKFADQVVVAMSNYQKPRYPETARSLAHDITQIHSSEYRNSQQLKPGPVLVVGAGNSGAEIAFELAREGRRVWLAGRDTGQAPIKITGFWSRVILARLLFRFVFQRLLTIRTPMGRKARPKILSHGTPLIRTRLPELLNAGVTRVARFTTSENGKPRLEDGTVLDVTNVIWSTGFDGGFDWIDLPVFDELGAPIHDGGIVKAQPGFYFVGLNFLYSMSSSMIHGVSRDAARIAKHLSDERHRLLTAH